jgi:hypothetical protein
MRVFSKSERYRRLAMRETNKAIIGLFHRLADEAERRERASMQRRQGPATIVSLALWLAQRQNAMSFAAQ